MTEQPPPSAEAMRLADDGVPNPIGLATAIDALCEQRVSAAARHFHYAMEALTERARLFANQTYTGPDSYARYRKALADEFAAVASEHQAALLARLREPEMQRVVAEAVAGEGGTWKMADAALAVITEKLTP